MWGQNTADAALQCPPPPSPGGGGGDVLAKVKPWSVPPPGLMAHAPCAGT